QVSKIVLIDKPGVNPILAAASTKNLKGATVFVRSCAKCHSHKGYGGFKAPSIELVTIRRPNDESLKEFIKNPAKTLGRNVGMSAFAGTEEELRSLVEFLRTLEPKTKLSN
ncbi:MAG: cytochrome c, partial [Pseudomonadota bacterium]